MKISILKVENCKDIILTNHVIYYIFLDRFKSNLGRRLSDSSNIITKKKRKSYNNMLASDGV